MTLKDFFGKSPSSLSSVIQTLSESSVKISEAVRNAATLNLTGSKHETNVQGEEVQKLDDFSNLVLMDVCKTNPEIAGYLSEENEGITTFKEKGTYVIAVDPLDGSSNIDIAAPVGTIFAIWKRKSTNGELADEDFLQSGESCVGAGFFLYGSSTLLLFSTGSDVRLFSYDTQAEDYILVNEKLALKNVSLDIVTATLSPLGAGQ